MNAGQITSNLVWLLNQTNFCWPLASSASETQGVVTWTPSATPILGRVAVTPQAPTLGLLDQVTPSVLIRPERVAPHGEHPADLEEEARWTVTLYALNATDQAGGAAVVGGNRSVPATPGSPIVVPPPDSLGRGLLEIEPLLRAQIQQAFIGANVRPRITSIPATVPEALEGLLAARAFEVVATRFPAQLSYANVSKLAATLVGGATLTWAPVPSRWDLVAYQVNRANGANAIQRPDQGTVLTSTLAPTATGYVDVGGGAGKTYAVWGVYDAARDPWSGGRSSAPPSAYSGFYLPDGTFTYRLASVNT